MAKNAFRFVPDVLYLNLYFKAKLGYTLDLSNPLTYNEKLQWMKLNYHDSRLPLLVDKYAVRSYVEERIGADYLVPLIGLFDTVQDFLAFDLPDEFVAKCTHDSQSTCICSDKKSFDFSKAALKLNKAMKRNWYWQSREWAYKSVRPRVLVEKYLRDGSHLSPTDYKLYFFNGVCHLIQSDVDRFEDKDEQWFTPDWKCRGSLTSRDIPKKIIEPPSCLQEMLQLSSILADDFPHVRVDWYCIDGSPYFGELTFYTGGGFDAFYPKKRGIADELDMELGSLFELPNRLS